MEQLPSQITENLGGVIFSSCFDTGNLGSVKREGPNKYILTIQSDQGNGKMTGYRTWFHFYVEGLEQETTFVITNMQNQSGLFRDGMQPVFRAQDGEWQRIKYPCTYRMLPEGPMELTFRHQPISDNRVYLAFSYSWSFEENERFIDQLQTRASQIPELYFKRSTLIFSKEGRRVTLLTITNNSSIEKEEEPIQYLFPEGRRPMTFKKRYIFVSARVHPGEVPGSFVMNGLLNFYCPMSKAAMVAREQYVWCIVPIINPDGVYRGHYRTDSFCQNLNRYYISPSLTDHPCIYGIKEYIMRLYNTDRLYSYLDLHAHAGHKGIFIYGNQLPTLSQHTLSCLLPRLMCLYSEIFDYDGCNFTEKNMYAADKGDGLSKDGAGRVAIYKATNIIHSYTLECNYNTGKYTNILNRESNNDPYHQDNIDENIVLQPLPPQTNAKTYFYTIMDYELVGKAYICALLDINYQNPQSRITDSYFRTLPNLHAFLAYNILKTMPFRFENYLRKILKNINNKEQVQRTLKAFYALVSTGQIKDGLETEAVQKPITKYQKAQELKQSRQNLKPLPRRQTQQEAIQQQPYPFSAIDLDRQKAKEQNQSRARSQELSKVQVRQRQFKIKVNKK